MAAHKTPARHRQLHGTRLVVSSDRVPNKLCGRLVEDSPHNEKTAQGWKTLGRSVPRQGLEPRTY